MKTDRAAVLWGATIGIVLIAAVFVFAFEFPDYRLPFTGRQADIFLVSITLFGILIASYRTLWRTPAFWGLMLAFLGAHITFYWLFFVRIAEAFSGFRIPILYGVISGVEVLVFAVIIARLYHQGPGTRSFTKQN